MLSKMDKLVDIGLIKQGEEENLYNNMLARIANSDLSSRNLSVSVVDALSSLVFLVKNKWKDKVPSTHLTKKQFVHILAYICDRRSTLEEQDAMKIRSIWRPNMLQKEMERNRDALWPGLKFLGVNIGNATGTDYNFFLNCSISQQATRVRQRGGMIRWTRYLTEAMTQVQIFLHLRCSYYELVIAQLLGLTIHILVLMLIQTIFLPLQPLNDDKYAIKFFFCS